MKSYIQCISYLVIGILLLVFISILSVNFLTRYISASQESFENPPVTADQLKVILKKSRPTGEDIAAFQGAYQQFLTLHRDFCKPWTRFLEVGRDYEKQSTNETANGGNAVGLGTTKEYVRLLSLREGKTFIDCSVAFPETLDIGINMQQMPYESTAYIESLNFGTAQLKKILADSKKALQGIPVSERFLDLIGQNCEEKDGVIRCVVSIDTTNRNLEQRTEKRLVEILENEQKIRQLLNSFNSNLAEVEELKRRAESGEIAADVKVTI